METEKNQELTKLVGGRLREACGQNIETSFQLQLRNASRPCGKRKRIVQTLGMMR